MQTPFRGNAVWRDDAPYNGLPLLPPSTDLVCTPPVGEDLLRNLLANWEKFLHEANDLDPLIRLKYTMRYQTHDHTSCAGHVSKGSFKNFRIQDDEHCLTVCRCLRRSVIRAEFVSCAEEWRWGSTKSDCQERRLLVQIANGQ